MSCINILHLSDLHISSKRLSATSKKLIEDIGKQVLYMNDILLVVSGDVVDRGEYAKYKDGVILFFQTLKDTIGNKAKEIVIVPGNHDKERSNSNVLYGKLSQIKDIEISEDIWKLQEQNYKSYLAMVSDIRKIFKLKCKKIEETFGVDLFEIKGNNICFVEIDTSWGSCGETEEEGKLVIGRYQLDSLIEQYELIKGRLEEEGKQVTLTIGVGHHPINWLKPEQMKKLKKYMIDEEYFNMNLYLCGHIHDMDLENWYNNERSLMTLVTGVGWNHRIEDNNEKDKKDEHRYSIYVIDPFKNSCNIIMRKSQKNGRFISDYSVYVKDEDKPGKLCYPLKIENNNQPFICMNSVEGDLIKSIFVDVNLMDLVKKVHGSIVEFRKKTAELLRFYEKNYLERLEEFYDDVKYKEIESILSRYFFGGEVGDDSIHAVLNEYSDVVHEQFTAYLQDVLANFVSIFEADFPSDSNLRVHFRWYKKEKDEYLKLCQYSNIDQYEGPSVSSIPWGGLIEHSYKINDSLIYSINSNYNNHEPVKWDDFMTVVPSFLNSEQEFRDSQNKKIRRPSMTFGISVLNNLTCDKEELSKILYIFEYLGLSQLISEILDDYINVFIIDCAKYMEYIDGQRRIN